MVEGVAIKVPGAQELHLPASILRPGVAVDKRGVESECEDARRQEQAHQKLANHWLRWQTQGLDTACDEIEFLAENKNSKVKSREVMVEEQLPSHEIEWEVMKEPSKHTGSNLIIEPLEVDVVVVTAVSLPPNNRDSLEDEINTNGHRR